MYNKLHPFKVYSLVSSTVKHTHKTTTTIKGQDASIIPGNIPPAPLQSVPAAARALRTANGLYFLTRD